MAVIRYLLRAARWQMVSALVSGLLNGLSGAGLVALVVIVAFHHREYRDYNLEAIFVALSVFMVVTRIVSSLFLTRLGQSAIHGLRLDLSRKILTAPYHRLQELGAPRLLANLTEDVAAISETFAWIPLLCVNGATVIGCLAYIGWLSPVLLGMVASVMGFGVASFRFFQQRALSGLARARECEDRLFRHFRGLTEGVKELKLNRDRRDAFVVGELQATADVGKRHYLSGMTTYVLAVNWGIGLFYVLIGLFLFVLPLRFPLEDDVLTGAVFAVMYMMAPLVNIFNGLPILGRAQIALEKVQGLAEDIEAVPRCADSSAVPPGCEPVRELSFCNVTHRYFRDESVRDFVLGPVSFSLVPGEVVFLVGGNGSGKTTLALLLVGLYAPEHGEIRLNGKLVDDRNRESYRQHFSAVFSDFYLFESLLGFENRALDDKAREYLGRLQLDHKVKIEDGRFSTLNLSQGQRKRLALLVAYLEDRPFYVFDEWAADQDPVFKKIFYTEILASLKARGKSVFVITHDDGYFHLADRCLKLDEGRIAELAVSKNPEPEDWTTPTGYLPEYEGNIVAIPGS